MRRLLPFLILLLSCTSAFAQVDIQKATAEFEKMLKDPNAIPYGSNKAAGKYYSIRGFKMYCEIYGSGEPLLIIHGNGGSIENFSKNIPFFSKKYKVIIADSRAQG